MKVAAIGVGSAGGRIIDELSHYSDEAELDIIEFSMAVNTSIPGLLKLNYLEREQRILVGGDEVNGHGVGLDNRLGAKMMNRDVEEVLRRIHSGGGHEADAALLVGGLAGGSGSGGMPVLSQYIRREFDMPVICFGILPDDVAGKKGENTVSSLRTLKDTTDNIILFDNDKWLDDERAVTNSFLEVNRQIVVHLSTLLATTEPLSSPNIGEELIESSDVLQVLSEDTISILGYADRDVKVDEGALGRFLRRLRREKYPEPEDPSEEIVSAVKEASLNQMSVSYNLKNGCSGIICVCAGPEEFLSKNGIDEATEWLRTNTNCDNVRSGDYPLEYEQHYISSVVLVSGPKTLQRFIDLFDSVIGLDNIKENIGASEITERVLTGDNGPEPIFDTESDGKDVEPQLPVSDEELISLS